MQTNGISRSMHMMIPKGVSSSDARIETFSLDEVEAVITGLDPGLKPVKAVAVPLPIKSTALKA